MTNAGKSLLPINRLSGHISLPAPEKICQPVMDRIPLHHKTGAWPGAAQFEVPILTGSGAIDSSAEHIETALLPCARKDYIAHAANGPEKISLIFAPIKHPRPFKMDGPGVGRIDDGGG